MNLKNKNILVTGGAGFLGSFVVKELIKNGANPKRILIPRSKDYDLRKESVAKKITKDQDVVIHLAGNVGGIGKNLLYPGTLYYDNILMGTHLIHSSMENKVEKVVIIGTVCSYPKYTQVPFREGDLWMGYPEETNAPYGLAKKMLLVQSQAYRQQYGLNSIFLMLVNLYGPGDNFDPKSSHVIPALIRKINDAKKNHLREIEVWGDGSATREFLYVEEAAKAIVMATKKYNLQDPINIGRGEDISIKNLVELIAKIMKYNGKIVWDTSKPNGQPKRLLEVTKAKEEFGFKANITFEKGLTNTIKWYLKNSKNE